MLLNAFNTAYQIGAAGAQAGKVGDGLHGDYHPLDSNEMDRALKALMTCSIRQKTGTVSIPKSLVVGTKIIFGDVICLATTPTTRVTTNIIMCRRSTQQTMARSFLLVGLTDYCAV